MSDNTPPSDDLYVRGLAKEVADGMEELMRTAKLSKREVKINPDFKADAYTLFMMGASSTLVVLVALALVYSYFFKKKVALAAVGSVADCF